MISNKLAFVVAVFGMAVSMAHCQVPMPGKCPAGVQTVTELDINKYLGKWYEHSKYPAIFEVGGKCNQAVYGLFENGSVSVVNSQSNIITGAVSHINGYADLTDEVGKIVVNFPSVGRVGGKANYWVLATDYTSYAVVYSCTEHIKNMMHISFAWILTRDRVPAQEVIDTAYAVFDKNGISKALLLKTDHTNCPADM